MFALKRIDVPTDNHLRMKLPWDEDKGQEEFKRYFSWNCVKLAQTSSCEDTQSLSGGIYPWKIGGM